MDAQSSEVSAKYEPVLEKTEIPGTETIEKYEGEHKKKVSIESLQGSNIKNR